MEKDLLEDEQDNWLLKSTPKKTVTSFSGSPLQIPNSNRTVSTRPPFSPIGGVKGSNDKTEQAVNIDNVGKENTGGVKVELPKLSVERQQMKKKKKNAGFNLRKSLAWDKAFSTEEGVLDPVELSRVTGNDLLPAIQEDFRETLSASKCASVSPGLQALEENLFNDLPVNSKSREKNKTSGLPPKYASPSSSAQRKVVPAQDSRSGTKRSGCPRPPPSSSPANVYTTTPQGRETSVSKASTTRYDPPTVANSMKRTTQCPSKPKQSQPTQSKNSHRSMGSISFSNSTSTTKSNTKSSLTAKSSIPKPSFKQNRKNLVNKSSEVPLVSNSQYSIVGKSDVGPMTTLGQTSNFPNSNVMKMSTSLAQSSCSRVGKASGLRVPSPSIGYFNQSDSQPSHSARDKHSQLNRSSLIPTFKKPQVPAKLPRVNSKSVTGNIGSLGPVTGLSSKSLLRKPSEERVKVDLKSTQEVESRVSFSSSSSQMNESLQGPCIIQGDAGKLVLDDVAICTSEKVSTAKCEEFPSTSKLSPSDCQNNVEDCSMSDDKRDERSPTFLPLKHGQTFKDSMDSPVDGPISRDVGNEDEISPFVSREKDALAVIHSSENVLKQPEVLDSFTAEPGLPEDSATRKSDEDHLSSSETQLGYTESALVLSGPAEAQQCVHSPCNRHCMVCDDGQAVKNPEKIPEVSNIAETNCEDGPLPDCKYWFRESEEHNLSCQPVLEEKEGSHELDVLTRNERADKDDGPDMEVDYYTGSLDVEQTIEEVNSLVSSPAEVRMEDKPLESSHNRSSEKLISEKLELYNCSSVANTSDVKVDQVIKQTDQVGASDDCSPAKDVSTVFFSYSNGQFEDNSEVEDMDLVTESDCSDEESAGNLELKEVNLATASELISDLDEFSVKEILSREYLEVETIHTDLDLCGKTKTLFGETVNSSPSIFNDPWSQDEDTNLSRVTEGIPKEDSTSGRIEHNFVEKAKFHIVTKDDLGAHVSDQDFVLHGEEQIQVTKISPEPVAFMAREEESETPIPMSEAFSFTADPAILGDFATRESDGDHLSSSENQLGHTESVCVPSGPVEAFDRVQSPSNNVEENAESNSVLCVENMVCDGQAVVETEKITEVGYITETNCETDFTGPFLDWCRESEEQHFSCQSLLERKEQKRISLEARSESKSAISDGHSPAKNVPSNDTPTSESNGTHASESSSNCTSESEGKDQMILVDEKKPNPIIVKPLNAVPFSDEWLAAVEAAGEEILTLKSGRVQHSPTDKSAPEPGPWSPVKKKNNQVVGPFDCTKYTNKGLPPTLD